MKIAIPDDYQQVVRELDCLSLLDGHDVRILSGPFDSADALAEALQGVEALVLIRERTCITEALLAQLPDLRLISQTGRVSQHIDVALCERYGVQVLEGRGSPVAPAELCWALIMAASRHLPAYITHLQQGRWQCAEPAGLGRVLSGRTLGIWGYGRIGQRIAGYGQAFGMQVMVWGSQAAQDRAEADGLACAESREVFFSQVDVLSLHLRLVEATRGLVTRQDLARMKPDALLVNISRAELIEPGALHDALIDHPRRMAALDVFEQEPATADTDPLLALPNVMATPHLGYVEKDSYELYFSVAFENLVNACEGNC
ncbi:D-2-hydroxyacid dehydrogenase family protein [Larsenimonas rhizosphaerae]|uniref:D-2-hydroxyacid dehydrogenase family protein n=1 Tax=Larsenimonas rhizosphaerae TaxID=2944682 RepID=A0AA42CWM1_9GAMM|nr:D-2-hydroxyacid dehydrogenase family protein [Larsenimonas rhizosphaerae]MCX2522773.1 D-2-hydroxyacid dehydrogenase family protein [Larsenimonas rhizosphaerae]